MHVARNLFRLHTDGSCTHKIPQCHQNMEHLRARTQVFGQSEPGNCQAMLVNWQLLSGLLVIASPTDILLEYMHKPFHTTLQVNILHFRIYAITLELVYFFLLIRYDYSTNFKCLITFSTTSHAVTILCTGRRVFCFWFNIPRSELMIHLSYHTLLLPGGSEDWLRKKK